MPDERVAWAVQLRARAAVRALIAECEREGIAVLPVKGIVTAALLYDDIAERSMLDADVRVLPRDLERALVAAKRAGAHVYARYFAYRSAILMFDEMQVDVETSVGPPGMCGLTVEAMLSRATPSTLLGFAHLVPEIHDHALLLAVNVFKDKLTAAQAGSLEDVRRIAAKLDPRTFAARAREADSATLTWIVADYMFSRHADPAWQRILDALGPPSRPRYADLLRRLRDQPKSLPTRVLARMVNDKPSRRIQALIHMGAFTFDRLRQGRRL